MVDASRLERALLASPLLVALEDEQVPGRSAEVWRRQLVRGEALFEQHSQCDALTLIQRGVVKLTHCAPDGVESILGLVGPRECAGTVAALPDTLHPSSAYAVTEGVEVLALPGAWLRDAASSHPAVADALGEVLRGHLQAMLSKIEVLNAGSTSQRLARLLLSLAARFGDQREGGAVVVPTALSRAELAALASAREESANRILSSWQTLGVVRLSANGFEVRAPRILDAVVAGLEVQVERRGDSRHAIAS